MCGRPLVLAFGLKTDLRWIAIALSRLLNCRYLNDFPLYSAGTKKFWQFIFPVVTLVIMFFFGADFATSSYNHTRIGFSALNLKDDPYEMFPVWFGNPSHCVDTAPGWPLLYFHRAQLFRRSHGAVDANNIWHKFEYNGAWYLVALLLMFWFVYAFLQFKPLNPGRMPISWMIILNHSVCIKPQNFITIKTAQNPILHYSTTISSFLQLNSTVVNNYERTIMPNSRSFESRPNRCWCRESFIACIKAAWAAQTQYHCTPNELLKTGCSSTTVSLLFLVLWKLPSPGSWCADGQVLHPEWRSGETSKPSSMPWRLRANFILSAAGASSIISATDELM